MLNAPFAVLAWFGLHYYDLWNTLSRSDAQLLGLALFLMFLSGLGGGGEPWFSYKKTTNINKTEMVEPKKEE